MDTIVKAHNWSLVDAADRNGDTALHVAARFVHFFCISNQTITEDIIDWLLLAYIEVWSEGWVRICR